MKDTVLYFVIPCYNEEAVLPETAKSTPKSIAAAISNTIFLFMENLLPDTCASYVFNSK